MDKELKYTVNALGSRVTIVYNSGHHEEVMFLIDEVNSSDSASPSLPSLLAATNLHFNIVLLLLRSLKTLNLLGIDVIVDANCSLQDSLDRNMRGQSRPSTNNNTDGETITRNAECHQNRDIEFQDRQQDEPLSNNAGLLAPSSGLTTSLKSQSTPQMDGEQYITDKKAYSRQYTNNGPFSLKPVLYAEMGVTSLQFTSNTVSIVVEGASMQLRHLDKLVMEVKLPFSTSIFIEPENNTVNFEEFSIILEVSRLFNLMRPIRDNNTLLGSIRALVCSCYCELHLISHRLTAKLFHVIIVETEAEASKQRSIVFVDRIEIHLVHRKFVNLALSRVEIGNRTAPASILVESVSVLSKVGGPIQLTVAQIFCDLHIHEIGQIICNSVDILLQKMFSEMQRPTHPALIRVRISNAALINSVELRIGRASVFAGDKFKSELLRFTTVVHTINSLSSNALSNIEIQHIYLNGSSMYEELRLVIATMNHHSESYAAILDKLPRIPFFGLKLEKVAVDICDMKASPRLKQLSLRTVHINGAAFMVSDKVTATVKEAKIVGKEPNFDFRIHESVQIEACRGPDKAFSLRVTTAAGLSIKILESKLISLLKFFDIVDFLEFRIDRDVLVGFNVDSLNLDYIHTISGEHNIKVVNSGGILLNVPHIRLLRSSVLFKTAFETKVKLESRRNSITINFSDKFGGFDNISYTGEELVMDFSNTCEHSFLKVSAESIAFMVRVRKTPMDTVDLHDTFEILSIKSAVAAMDKSTVRVKLVKPEILIPPLSLFGHIPKFLSTVTVPRLRELWNREIVVDTSDVKLMSLGYMSRSPADRNVLYGFLITTSSFTISSENVQIVSFVDIRLFVGNCFAENGIFKIPTVEECRFLINRPRIYRTSTRNTHPRISLLSPIIPFSLCLSVHYGSRYIRVVTPKNRIEIQLCPSDIQMARNYFEDVEGISHTAEQHRKTKIESTTSLFESSDAYNIQHFDRRTNGKLYGILETFSSNNTDQRNRSELGNAYIFESRNLKSRSNFSGYLDEGVLSYSMSDDMEAFVVEIEHLSVGVELLDDCGMMRVAQVVCMVPRCRVSLCPSKLNFEILLEQNRLEVENRSAQIILGEIPHSPGLVECEGIAVDIKIMGRVLLGNVNLKGISIEVLDPMRWINTLTKWPTMISPWCLYTEISSTATRGLRDCRALRYWPVDKNGYWFKPAGSEEQYFKVDIKQEEGFDYTCHDGVLVNENYRMRISNETEHIIAFEYGRCCGELGPGEVKGCLKDGTDCLTFYPLIVKRRHAAFLGQTQSADIWFGDSQRIVAWRHDEFNILLRSAVMVRNRLPASIGLKFGHEQITVNPESTFVCTKFVYEPLILRLSDKDCVTLPLTQVSRRVDVNIPTVSSFFAIPEYKHYHWWTLSAAVLFYNYSNLFIKVTLCQTDDSIIDCLTLQPKTNHVTRSVAFTSYQFKAFMISIDGQTSGLYPIQPTKLFEWVTSTASTVKILIQNGEKIEFHSPYGLQSSYPLFIWYQTCSGGIYLAPGRIHRLCWNIVEIAREKDGPRTTIDFNRLLTVVPILKWSSLMTDQTINLVEDSVYLKVDAEYLSPTTEINLSPRQYKLSPKDEIVIIRSKLHVPLFCEMRNYTKKIPAMGQTLFSRNSDFYTKLHINIALDYISKEDGQLEPQEPAILQRLLTFDLVRRQVSDRNCNLVIHVVNPVYKDFGITQLINNSIKRRMLKALGTTLKMDTVVIVEQLDSILQLTVKSLSGITKRLSPCRSVTGPAISNQDVFSEVPFLDSYSMRNTEEPIRTCSINTEDNQPKTEWLFSLNFAADRCRANVSQWGYDLNVCVEDIRVNTHKTSNLHHDVSVALGNCSFGFIGDKILGINSRNGESLLFATSWSHVAMLPDLQWVNVETSTIYLAPIDVVLNAKSIDAIKTVAKLFSDHMGTSNDKINFREIFIHFDLVALHETTIRFRVYESVVSLSPTLHLPECNIMDVWGLFNLHERLTKEYIIPSFTNQW